MSRATAPPPDAINRSSFITEFIARRAVNRRVAVFAILVAAVLLVMNLYAPADPTALQRLMASLLLCLCSLPMLMWASGRDWGHSLMPIIGVTYGLYFGSPVLLRQDFYGHWLGSPRMDDSLIDLTLFLALAGWALLLAGYFGPHRRWLAGKLPRVEVIPAEMQRYASALAVIIGIAAAPFFYIHIGNLVAFYTGRDLLPPGTAFPVELAGECVVLSILILFCLQLRGQLGLAGKSFMWLLLAYYTVLGMSSGLVLHGMSAILALFVVWVVTAPVPSWKGAACGVLTAAILLLVLLPMRHEFRALIWTHGVDPLARQSLRTSTHVFTLPGDTGAETPVVETPGYDIFYGGGVLTYYYKDLGACSTEPADSVRRHFFLHVFPVDSASLPSHRAGDGYDNFDFALDEDGVAADGQCVHRVPLPAYAIDRIRTGLFTRVIPDASVLRWAHLGESMARWQGKTLATFVGGSYRNIHSDGQWGLWTVDAASWELDTERKGAWRRRLHINETDEAERAVLAAVQPGDLIRVEVDADNWAEYAVDQTLLRPDDPRVVIYRLRALIDHEGDRSALREGGSPATFFYPNRDESVTLPVTAWTETRESIGRNPFAPSAHLSQGRKAALYIRTVRSHAVGGASPGRFHSALHAASTRLDMLLPVAWVIRQTPENVPYLGGETYSPILFKLIPRLVWEGKPKNARDLGQRYGFLPKGTEINAFKIHHVGEMYANFGVPGVLLGMLLLGVLYRATYQLFFHAGASVVTMAGGTHILTVLVQRMESIASSSLGFILWYAVLLALLGAVARIALRAKRSVTRAG